jgi:hypothetical protein
VPSSKTLPAGKIPRAVCGRKVASSFKNLSPIPSDFITTPHLIKSQCYGSIRLDSFYERIGDGRSRRGGPQSVRRFGTAPRLRFSWCFFASLREILLSLSQRRRARKELVAAVPRCITSPRNLSVLRRFRRADFSPRGTLVPLPGSEAKASRGLKPALHDLVAALLLCGAWLSACRRALPGASPALRPGLGANARDGFEPAFSPARQGGVELTDGYDGYAPA